MRRAKIMDDEQELENVISGDYKLARQIVECMDGLPLALDQAGAYIEEVGCSLSAYLDMYYTCQQELLQRRGHLPIHHPESVTTTWTLSFQQVEQVNPVASDLLRLCAFLDPDTIPEDLHSTG